jgi:cytochrome c oxidase subunit 3
MVQVGTMVWLSSELMFFAGLFAIYFQLRSVSAPLWAEQTAKLNITFAFINTAILVVSSVWCQIGVMKAERGQAARTGKLTEIGKWGMREWYVVTYLFGATFIAGQVLEYAKLVSENVTLSSDRYGSVFYMATGFHGLHVTGGLIAFLLIIGRTFTTRRYTHTQAVGAVVTSYYWHFVDVVWIALFAVIYLLK